MTAAINIALIGHGAIGRYVRTRLAKADHARVSAVVMRPDRVAAVQDDIGDSALVVGSIDDLPAPLPALVVEAAGHAGLAEHGAAALARGLDLLVVSVGALADHALYERLGAAARSGGAKLLIAPGAIGGIDALAAAREGGLAQVRYTSRKPPGAWKGSPAEKVGDLDALTEATELYAGPADEAARLYPKNANVAATIALAGMGFADTAVRLVADPEADGNIHLIEAEGAFGAMTVEMRGKPLPDNPKTSSLTAFSVLRAIRNRANAIEI
ncbi:MAG TPA: aspartate dehydrogenase [Alphaproteobacteria bacterium]|nr:aspartate dehydrogenase [Alphaproteobacteria bacterium]